jgi:peptide-methionine (S)-S-oxide reductase
MTDTKTEQATFAAGCFWGVEAEFRQIPGVIATTVGYTGGRGERPTYEQVCSHTTGHAEAVLVEFDPAQVSYEELLDTFWRLHDPTQLNRQGPDVGTQYRSAIFYADETQHRDAQAYIDQLAKSKHFDGPIVTQVVPLKRFYLAEAYHQNFAERNPDYPYIVYHDRPKIEALRAKLPQLWQERLASR